MAVGFLGFERCTRARAPVRSLASGTVTFEPSFVERQAAAKPKRLAPITMQDRFSIIATRTVTTQHYFGRNELAKLGGLYQSTLQDSNIFVTDVLFT
jgi:hypothetical protein